MGGAAEREAVSGRGRSHARLLFVSCVWCTCTASSLLVALAQMLSPLIVSLPPALLDLLTVTAHCAFLGFSFRLE